MISGMPKTARARRHIPADPERGPIRPSASRRRRYPTRKQLDELRRSLLRRREELTADMLQLDSELHDTQADQDKSDQIECCCKYEQADVVTGLLQSGRHELCEINDALDRMDNGTYGICLATGAQIGIDRLCARPWAKYCIEYARALEKSRPRKVAG